MIEILYKRRSEEGVQRLVLGREEYYDALEPGERYEEDSVARFDHAVDYLEVAPEALEWTRLTGEDGTVVVERFSAQGRVRIWHRRDADGGQELCLTTTLAPGRHHLARLSLDSTGDWIPRWVNLYADQPDGSQIEESLLS